MSNVNKCDGPDCNVTTRTHKYPYHDTIPYGWLGLEIISFDMEAIEEQESRGIERQPCNYKKIIMVHFCSRTCERAYEIKRLAIILPTEINYEVVTYRQAPRHRGQPIVIKPIFSCIG